VIWIAFVWFGVPLLVGAYYVVREFGWKEVLKTSAMVLAIWTWLIIGIWLIWFICLSWF
jgi:hypothetical protein